MMMGMSSFQFTSRRALQTSASVGIVSMTVIMMSAICGPKKEAVEGPMIMPEPKPAKPRTMPVIKTIAMTICIGVWER